MFNAYLFDPVKGGVQEKYFLDKRTLAFIYVVSYLIQKENSGTLDPDLCHVMGHALLLWLPNHELVEHYLSLSAQSNRDESLSDGFLLVRLFCPNIGFSDYGFAKDLDKAIKYAIILFNNPLNKHWVENYDYAYARVLFEKDKNNAEECIKIIDKKLNKFNIEFADFTDALLNYLLLELEIAAKVRVLSINLDLNYVETVLLKMGQLSLRRNKGLYWLAQCYIEGKNNEKNIKKAIELLTSINDPYLFKDTGASLAKLYLDGDGVDCDAREALDIACLAEMQAELHPYARTDSKSLDDIMHQASIRLCEEKYITFLKDILGTPVHCVNSEAIETLLKFHLSDEEYSYLMNEYNSNDHTNNTLKSILRKLRHPVVKKELSCACNRMIYVGTDESGYDNYFNFEECGNMLIYGTCGAGKTWFIYSIYKRLRNKDTCKSLNYAFWSFKPFEFEDWCGDYLIQDTHELIKYIANRKKQSDNQTIVFIDEFMDFLWNITDEEKEILIDAFKNAREYNITFICCSQNMNLALEEFGDFANTKICMMCYDEEKSANMIGNSKAASITKYGNMYVFNPAANGFSTPKQMKVIKNN